MVVSSGAEPSLLARGTRNEIVADPTDTSAAALQPAAAAETPPIRTGPTPVRYVNFCQVTSTPEDVTIDLGLQTAEGAATGVWESPQRISLNFVTVKRLVEALRLTLEQYEATFGTVETNIEKRLSGSPK
jgi:hypothetical protein